MAELSLFERITGRIDENNQVLAQKDVKIADLIKDGEFRDGRIATLTARVEELETEQSLIAEKLGLVDAEDTDDDGDDDAGDG